jgi:CheY-like chemotaxis protein
LPVRLAQLQQDGDVENMAPQACADPNMPVLIVEDNPVNQQVLQRMLSKFGYQSDVANHGLEALRLLENHAYSVVLMDLQMPIMNGYQCTREIRALPGPTATIPIIAVTANLLDTDRKGCMESGMNDFLPKPVKLAYLEQTLARYCCPSADNRPSD